MSDRFEWPDGYPDDLLWTLCRGQLDRLLPLGQLLPDEVDAICQRLLDFLPDFSFEPLPSRYTRVGLGVQQMRERGMTTDEARAYLVKTTGWPREKVAQADRDYKKRPKKTQT